MGIIDYTDDSTGFKSEVRGSDQRLNTSARNDSRGYYNSRDKGLAFTLVFDHQGAAAGEFAVLWKNKDPDRQLVISHVGLNAVQSARIKLHFVTGTAAGGTVITPTNTNKTASHTASSTAECRQGASGDAITGITSESPIDFVSVPGTGTVAGHEELRLGDLIRLGQDDAIALEYVEGTTGDFWGVIFGYYE